MESDGTSCWSVSDKAGALLGSVIRTSPAADNVIGFQGPTDTLLCFGEDKKMRGVLIGKSYDNEPYVGYVREDAYFRTLFNKKSISDLAAIDLDMIEGVSGATMTSAAVTEGMVLAATATLEQESSCLLYTSPSPRDLSTSRMPSSA